jgi:hypothetical protein
LKATESVGYVRHALNLHPDIDIVATHEVFDQMASHGAALSHVLDSGMSDSVLADHASSAVEHAAAASVVFHVPALVTQNPKTGTRETRGFRLSVAEEEDSIATKRTHGRGDFTSATGIGGGAAGDRDLPRAWDQLSDILHLEAALRRPWPE